MKSSFTIQPSSATHSQSQFVIPQLSKFPVTLLHIDVDFSGSMTPNCMHKGIMVMPPLFTKIVLCSDDICFSYEQNVSPGLVRFTLTKPIEIHKPGKEFVFNFFNDICSNNIVNVRTATFYFEGPDLPPEPKLIPFEDKIVIWFLLIQIVIMTVLFFNIRKKYIGTFKISSSVSKMIG